MIEKGKKINNHLTLMPQVILVVSQLLFLTVLVSGFSFISRSSFNVHERTLSNIHLEEIVSLLYD
tara:strand:+ start:43 stop:237 length:195 start_codon:yes stop_codon:yes gene_type:complete